MPPCVYLRHITSQVRESPQKNAAALLSLHGVGFATRPRKLYTTAKIPTKFGISAEKFVDGREAWCDIARDQVGSVIGR